MKTKIALGAILLFSSMATFASNIVCETPGSLKILKVSESSVRFYADYESLNHNRELASADSVRDESQGKSITKVLHYLGEKYTVHISDRGSFSDVNDYMTIRSHKGHEVIYPLSCNFQG